MQRWALRRQGVYLAMRLVRAQVLLNIHSLTHNNQTLKAATRNAALSLGVFSSLGSLSPGKLADFLIYPPGIDLMGPELPSTEIQYVALSGRVYNAATLEEVWPVEGRKLEPLPLSAD
jgi:imidazolonepropionase-like amidohydrolase